jgi:hypothetical protein
VSEDFQFQTRINPSWLAAVRVASPRLRIATPFPLMNIVAREKGVTATIEGQALVLTVGPGNPPPTWPSRQLDLLVILQRCADAASMLEAIRAAQPTNRRTLWPQNREKTTTRPRAEECRTLLQKSAGGFCAAQQHALDSTPRGGLGSNPGASGGAIHRRRTAGDIGGRRGAIRDDLGARRLSDQS